MGGRLVQWNDDQMRMDAVEAAVLIAAGAAPAANRAEKVHHDVERLVRVRTSREARRTEA